MAAHLTKGLGAAATTAGGRTGAKDLNLTPVARLATPPARAQCGVLTGGLVHVQPLLQCSEQGGLPDCFPLSSSPTLTGQLIGGGGGEAIPAMSSLRAQKEVQAATSVEVDRLAAAAMAGLGAGKKDVVEPASWEDETRHPHECILFGLSTQELMMVVPKVVGMASSHMNVFLPKLVVEDMGATWYLA